MKLFLLPFLLQLVLIIAETVESVAVAVDIDSGIDYLLLLLTVVAVSSC